jgi:hypothetical protein
MTKLEKAQKPDKSRAKGPLALGQVIQVSAANLRLEAIPVDEKHIARAVAEIKSKK